jgi:hypothetical protein
MTWDRWVAVGFGLWLGASIVFAFGWAVGRRLLLEDVWAARRDPAADQWPPLTDPIPMWRTGGLSGAWYQQTPDDTDEPDGWLWIR